MGRKWNEREKEKGGGKGGGGRLVAECTSNAKHRQGRDFEGTGRVVGAPSSPPSPSRR